MGGVITGLAFTAQFPSIDTTTATGNTQLQGFTLGAYNIGSFFGSLITAVISEPLGRKKSIMLGCAIIAIGTALQISSFALSQLIVCSRGRCSIRMFTILMLQVGRFVTGLGNGMITSSVPVWHAELSDAADRGKLITTELSTNVVSIDEYPF